ncbi:hypothetical protein [Labilibaculum manganireducens]|uniref:PPi-type phosphoenolpyruvate carboxykinase lobe 2 domain-containing protein n=1 Tax=Labilibaculum manganireducens TaxID=1940525 RepID=A0A2N3HSF5_9BACT|nr:hypothetical protein [Labilibaculum manganireducens]PKQ60982.1 hypothetical protein BZG01_20095 [Labilibaculum manganireducens]
MQSKNPSKIEIKSKEVKIDQKDLIRYINLQLAAMGQPIFTENSEGEKNQLSDPKFIQLTDSLIKNYRAQSRLLADHLCPVDQRIQNFLNEYLEDVDAEVAKLPTSTFILDQPGIARELSLPPDKDEHITELLSSYRIKQGVLHNPKHDRRTTSGSFHIVGGSLPVPLDKIELPKKAFGKFLQAAFNPSSEIKQLPFTATQEEKAELMVSLLLRPIVCPEVKGIISQKSMEVRFFAPGSLVSNLDFVESIFGNAGDPNIPANDAGLDIEHWTGHTGCIVLAPQLLNLKKKELGLPHYDDATERQRNDGVCWKDENELYNNGNAFKLTCRSEKGVVITLIADNYFGYSKKEIKTQISYSANLYGLSEEEHSGGAIAFPRKNLGDSFSGALFMNNVLKKQYSFDEMVKQFGETMNVHPEGYAVDKEYSDIYYINENANIDVYESKVSWEKNGKEQSIRLVPNSYYVHPSGYKMHMEKHPSAPSWRLVSTASEGTFCHKPCTVSGGGKSEISKSLLNAIIYSSFYIQDMEKDFNLADQVINHDYTKRWKDTPNRTTPARSLLSSDRSLGSVVKLLTPSKYYTAEYNEFLNTIPDHVKALVLFVKRFYRPERTDSNWRDYFSVDVINGRKGHELLFNNRKIVASYLRVGFAGDKSWYLNKLRQDFIAAAKIQMEDDITASIVLPASRFNYLNKSYDNKSIKLTANCEERFFQRPDEAVHRGYDKEAEADLSMRNNFTSNYEPLTREDGKELLADAIGFDLYTKPIQGIIRQGAESKKSNYFISPSHTRIVNGKPSENPRYLQIRPDLVNPVDDRLAEIGIRLARKIPLDQPVHHPVNAVLPGRRNNPADKKAGIRALSVYNPVHYQELPELFMDFICSLTGKSPSTTGAGSEGALTKGPFNMLSPTTDLNNALLSYILTGYQGFSSAAGYVGTENRFDHDVSLLIPELWCRLKEENRDPKLLIQEGSLEKLSDFEYEGETIHASRLGYRITEEFLFRYMNRIFDEPQNVFNERMLKPEIQDLEAYADGIKNIVEAQKKVAVNYFKDNSVSAAIPPLQILLNIMAYGQYEGKEISDPELRKQFDRELVINSSWYQARLKNKQQIDINFYEKQIAYLEAFMANKINAEWNDELSLEERFWKAKKDLEHVKSEEYLQSLVGTIGADPLFKA